MPTSTSHFLYATWVAVLACLATTASEAQPSLDTMSAGRRYLLVYPDTTRNFQDPGFPTIRYDESWQALVYSAVNTTVHVSSADGPSGPISIRGGEMTRINLRQIVPAIRQLVTTSPCKVVRTAIELRADDPVLVHCVMITHFGGEAWTPLPVEAWGREYFAATLPGDVVTDFRTAGRSIVRTMVPAPAEILITAAFDNTVVTISPTGPLIAGCFAPSVTLNAGQTYLVQSYVDTNLSEPGDAQFDIAGTIIRATNPIGVLSGNSRAKIADEAHALSDNTLKNLLIEWLSPTDQHGTTFAFMPADDGLRPTGEPGEKLTEKRSAEEVTVFGTGSDPIEGEVLSRGGRTPYDRSIPPGRQLKIRHSPSSGAMHRTSGPAQLMSSAGTVAIRRTYEIYDGTPLPSYDTWGSYLVELTPRERWTTFAPLYASDMRGFGHYVNVVTDSAHRRDIYRRNGTRFVFNESIEGTDLVWGTMSLASGVTDWLEARNGATFGGYVYGMLGAGGHEALSIEFRGNDPWPVAELRYAEYTAAAYAYPLASSHRAVGFVGGFDTASILHGCGAIEFAVRLSAAPTAGLRSIEMRSSSNARLSTIEPSVLIGATSARIVVEPIDVLKDATASIAIVDRAGHVVLLPYLFSADNVRFDDDSVVVLGPVRTIDEVSRDIAMVNRGSRAAMVERVELLSGRAVLIDDVEPAPPALLAPGDSLIVSLRSSTVLSRGTYADTLKTSLACSEIVLPISLSVTAPCVTLSDVDWERLELGEASSEMLQLCNRAQDDVVLSSDAATVLTWDNPRFRISDSVRGVLRSRVLRPGECINVPVLFEAAAVGVHRTVARLQSNSVKCRDTSNWTATVEASTGAPSETTTPDLSLRVLPESEGSGVLMSCYIANSQHLRLQVFASDGHLIATLHDEFAGSGIVRRQLATGSLASGRYYVVATTEQGLARVVFDVRH